MTIEVRNLSKEYLSGRRRVRALSDVSFTIEAGANAVIAGRSGSGKTTLLNCLGGLERPDAGTVVCCGADITAMFDRELGRFQRHGMGYVFQAANLFSHLTVAENIGFPLALCATPDPKRKVLELLDRIGLREAATALPAELSGGEAQRVAVARALAHAPKILLADEPTANLDSATGRQVVQLMRELSESRQCTLVICTHDPEVIASAGVTFHMQDGRITGE